MIGPAARAENAANIGPRRSAIGSCITAARSVAAAARREDVVIPAVDQSNPILATVSLPSSATAQ